MHKSILQKPLEWVYKNFKKDTSKMLIFTGTVGWALSSLAQIMAIVVNPKISHEKKSFLVPQEFMDAVVNVGAFFLITLFTKKVTSRLCSTGKLAPQTVRNFLNKNKELYKDKIGKMSFNLDKVMENENETLKDSYYSFKDYATTVGTIGASIISCNLVTPIIRNATASGVQKSYIDMQKHSEKYNVYSQNTSGNMRI